MVDAAMITLYGIANCDTMKKARSGWTTGSSTGSTTTARTASTAATAGLGQGTWLGDPAQPPRQMLAQAAARVRDAIDKASALRVCWRNPASSSARCWTWAGERRLRLLDPATLRRSCSADVTPTLGTGHRPDQPALGHSRRRGLPELHDASAWKRSASGSSTCPSARSRTSGHAAAATAPCSFSPGIPTWCRPARWRTGVRPVQAGDSRWPALRPRRGRHEGQPGRHGHRLRELRRRQPGP